MNVHVIDHNSAHLHLIARLLVGLLPTLKTLTFGKTHSNHTQALANADLVVISGGTWLVNLNPGTHRRLMKKVVDSGKPAIGICLGAEALAVYFGAKLTELPQQVNGINKIRITDQDRTVPVYEHRRWAIHDMPPELRVLATSDFGVEMFRHTTLPLWGMQFHPEALRGKNAGHELFKATLDDMGFTTRTLRFA